MGSQPVRVAVPLVASIVVLVGTARVAAQCASQWSPSTPLAGVNGTVACSASWDPDGAGPLTPRIVLAGDFTAAGTTLANRICAYDPATGAWHTFGSGLATGVIDAVVGMPNGDLVAGGQFDTIGGIAADNVARWNGAGWQAMGTGLPAPGTTNGAFVSALAARPNGELVAGGAFTLSGTASVGFLAVWSGSAWVPLAGGAVDGVVTALATMPNGDVAVSGAFATAGGVPADRLARWNGASWSAIPAGPTSGNWVTCLAAAPNGDLLAGGESQAGSFPSIVYTGHAWRWNGAAWSSPWSAAVAGFGVSSPVVRAIAATPNGGFAVGGATLYREVSGTANTVTLPGPWLTETLLALPNSELIVGGRSSTSNDPRNVFRWDATGVASLAPASDGVVTFANEDRNGDLIAAGAFTKIAGVPASNLARRSGGAWSALGSGANGPVAAGARLDDGTLVVGGQFSLVDGVAVANLARWDGTLWSPFGGANGAVELVHALPGGGCLVAGSFSSIGGVAAHRVARWDGASWHPYGPGLFPPQVGGFALVTDVVPRANGGLLAVGQFAVIAGGVTVNVAAWDGTAWNPVLTGNRCIAAAALPNGDVVLGGNFIPSVGLPHANLVRWDGAAFHAFGAPDGPVRAIVSLPDGDVVIVGEFWHVGGVAAAQVARWNGTSWSPVGNGGGVVRSGPTQALRLELALDGDLLLHGHFDAVDGQATSGLARLSPTCPASAQAFGAGCSGSGGANVLTATALPWLGGQFAATAAGIGPDSLAFVVAGATPTAIPMSTILPAAGAGCTLHVTPDVLLLLVPAGGVATVAFAIPVQPALIGSGLHLQVAPIEFGVGGSIVGLTATNALTLTVGVP